MFIRPPHGDPPPVAAPSSEWGFYEPITTFDTRVGQGVDSTGYTSLDLPTTYGATYIYVRPDGNDANSGATHALAKQTLKAAYNALTDGAGDWLLVAAGATFNDAFYNTGKRSGASAAHPTVVTTYDTADPTNTAKFRLGVFSYAASPAAGQSALDWSGTAGGTRFVYLENGRCIKPKSTASTQASDLGQHVFLGGGNTSALVMFYNWDFGPCEVNFQGDYVSNHYPEYDITGNLTIGSPNMTGVTLTGGSSPTAGHGISGNGPNSGIPAGTTIVSWTPGTSTLVMSNNATATGTGVLANADDIYTFLGDVIFRRCVVAYAYEDGNAYDSCMYLAATTGFVIEDCIFYHGGWLGTNRNAIADVTLSAAFTGTTGAKTFDCGSPSHGTFTCVATNGSTLLTSVVMTSGYFDTDVLGDLIVGTGIPGGTMGTTNNGYRASDRKHNCYFASSNDSSMIFRRNISGQASSQGLQLRGGGQISDCAFVDNVLGFGVGGGDRYNYARPFGVSISGGHNVVVGAEDQDVGHVNAVAMWSQNVSSGGLTKCIFANKGSAGSGNAQPISGPGAAFDQPSYLTLSSSIVYSWEPRNYTMASGIAANAYPAQCFAVLTDNVTDGDSTWSSYGSGNVTSASFPDPTRTWATYATSLGYGSKQELWDYVIQHPEINWATNFCTYIRAGFGH